MLVPALLLAEKPVNHKEAFFVNALNLTEKLASILEAAKSSKNMQAAAVRIEQLVPKALEIKKKAQESGMNQLSKQERKRLTEKYKDRIVKASTKVMTLSRELSKSPEILQAIMKIQKAMN
ncbi:MAG: hypothetical protein MK132_00175 [Lentisphaerales bacterium]|nr:hypothetical protein [Lentisphaerales bacterium]